MTFHVPNAYRIRKGRGASDDRVGNNGAFRLPARPGEIPLLVVASDGEGWEHVSVSLPTRCPTWAEMCRVKGYFWDDTDCVVQFHPPQSENISNHSYCLHLWRKVDSEFELPPSWMVGYKEMGTLV